MISSTAYNCIYNSSKNLLLKLLDTNSVIVLYGKGGCGKTVLLDEIQHKIQDRGYKIECTNITEDLFTKKYIISLYDLSKISHINSNKYYLINMNL
jgi:chromosomal replication initiation ATPase DnaA